MTFAICATVWCMFWFYRCVKSDVTNNLAAIMIAWFILGWVPPAFFLLVLNLAGGSL